MSSSGWKRVNVEVHFGTLIEVLMAAIDIGMDSAPEEVRNLLVEAIKHGRDEGSMS